MTRSGSRILTTHVGSLIRPADLLQQSTAAKQSPQELARYEHTLRCATVNVVEQQINAGIDIVNDGEFGPSWSKYVLDRLTGFELRADLTFEPVWLGRDRIRFRQFTEGEFSTRRDQRAGTGLRGADRMVQFAKLVGRENVIAGTDCGFAQLETYQRVHPQVMWAKLDALSEGARLASQELWGLRLSRSGGS